MEAMCCRLVGSMPDSFIQSSLKRMEKLEVKIVRGQSPIQFDMTKPDEGYPCIHLKDNKCSMYGGRPKACQSFPYSEKSMIRTPNCSYTFVDGVRSGECNGCKS